MKKRMLKVGSIVLAACLSLSSALPVLAQESDQKIRVSFSDVTAGANTLQGEAKVMVSVSGVEGKVTIAQLVFDFGGDLQYRSTQFLKGADNPDERKVWLEQKNGNQLMTSIIAMDGINFNDSEDLFILTFSGTAGQAVSLSLSDLSQSYCIVNGEERKAEAKEAETFKASDKANVGKSAVINLELDKVSAFTAMNDSQITVKITNEDEAMRGDVINTTINTATISNGGHRDGTKPTKQLFVVTHTVVADSTYTVEISGIGYVTYKKTGVTFDEALNITNSEFIPGDVDNNGSVDATDKAMAQKLIDERDYSLAADFNRDGKVNTSDMTVFDGIKDTTEGGSTGGSTGGSAGGSSGGSTGGSSGGSAGGSSSGSSSGGSSSGGISDVSTSVKKEPFTDIESYAWAKDSIYTLKNRGIISGISETEFAPSNHIKRGDFVLILTRMLGISNEFTENFADVSADSYYYNAIGSAKAAGIASGDGDNFMPEATITRQDLITLAYRAFLNQGYITEADDLSVLNAFGDKADIAPYAQVAMASMIQNGIIQGADGLVNPLGFATRAEVAVMCARMLELMK